MTYLQALKESYELWWYLYQYFPIAKEDTPFWEKIKIYSGDCPLCHYKDSCDHCILAVKNLCFNHGSGTSFYIWLDYVYLDIGTEKEARQAAYDIYRALRDEYDKVKRRNCEPNYK